MKRIKVEKFIGLLEVSLSENITLYGLATPISNFFCKRKVLTAGDSEGRIYALLNTHKDIGPGKVSLKFKEV